MPSRLDCYTAHLGRILDADEVHRLLQNRATRFTSATLDECSAEVWKGVTVQERVAAGGPMLWSEPQMDLGEYGASTC